MAARAIAKYSKFSGFLFRQFQKEKKLSINHWLDTNREKYYETLNQIVIPDCMSIASEVPCYPERVQKMLSYNVPAFNDAWGFYVELLYRTVADKAHQTEENITKMYILRSILDILLTQTAMLDDLTDKSTQRRGKKSWHTICEGGQEAAIYDGTVMALLPLHVLKLHFRNDPGYVKMLESIAMSSLEPMIGQTLDILGQGTINPSLDHYDHCYTYKAGKFGKGGVSLSLIHAGITDDDMISRTSEVIEKTGKMFQVWDDFNDYFCCEEQTGKPSRDISNGATSWVSSTALKHFSSSQVQEFQDCYGSCDPAKVERVCKLYEEIDMPTLYVNYQIENYNAVKAKIKEIKHSKIEEACNCYLEWFAGHDKNIE